MEGTEGKATGKYRAVCYVCYTCYLTKPTTKKAANVAAVSHMNTYKHETGVSGVLTGDPE